MRTTAILNLKGGVAKTTTVLNMATVLAHDCSKKVLVIDADSQCNSTEWLGIDPVGKCTLADKLRRLDCRPCIYKSNFPGIDILPADDSLMDLDLSKVEGGLLDIKCLRDLAQTYERHQTYDFILIDCPPAFNAATAAALLAADDVIIPMKLDAFAIRGMRNLMHQIQEMKKLNPALQIAGILPTMWYRNPTIEEAEKALASSGLPVFSHIRLSTTVDRMTFTQQALLDNSKNSGALADYRRFVLEYMKEGK